MLFPTHLLVGFLVGRRWNLPVAWAIAGAALPDVVDKPLRMVGITALYHSIGHSLLFLVGSAILVFFGRQWIALWAGIASHHLLDILHMILNGRPMDVLFLAWPVVIHEPSVDLPPIEFAVYYFGTPAFLLESGIWIGAAVGMYRHRRSHRGR